MKKTVNKYYTLLILAIMFAAPGVAAYLFYQHPAWLGSSFVNRGTLLSPPVQLTSLASQPKWQIIFWSPGVCKQDCLKQVDVLSRIRLALGRKLYQVDQKLILGSDKASISEKMQLLLKEHDFHLAALSTDDKAKLQAIAPETKIFIANPDNFLILSYQFHVKPDDVYKDLKLLLNTTEKKSG